MDDFIEAPRDAVSSARQRGSMIEDDALDGRDVQIILCPDGPLLVRGRPVIVDADGNEISSGRGTVALCRCGASGIKPFCDGTHKINGFCSND